MCHVWNLASIDVFFFITEVLITKYKSQTQKYKLWIKWLCVIQLSLHLRNSVASFPRCCYYMGLTSLHVYKDQSAAFLSSLTEVCFIISQSRAAVMGCASICRPSMYQVTLPGEIITETLYVYIYIFFFFFKHAIAFVSFGSQFFKFFLPFW